MAVGGDFERGQRPSDVPPATPSSPVPPPMRPDGIDPPWRDARAAIARDILELLMASGKRAIFKRRLDGGQLTLETPYRATAFWPVPGGGQERLYPFLRAEFGSHVVECTSNVYFTAGEAFAGLAWQEIGQPIVKMGLTPLGTGPDAMAKWRKGLEAEGVPSRITRLIGKDTGYSTRVRSLACVGVQSPYGPIVFCIDSVRDDAFAPSSFTGPGDRTYRRSDDEWAINNLLGRAIPERVVHQRDFSVWARQNCKRLSAIVVGLCAIVALLAHALNLADAVSSAPWVVAAKQLVAARPQSIASWSCVAVFCLLALGFIPYRYRTAGYSQNAERIVGFVQRWTIVWVLTSLTYIAKAVSNQDAAHWTFIASGLLSLGTSCYVLGCYFCLIRFSQDEAETSALVVVPPWVGAPLLALAGQVLFYQDVPFVRDCVPAIALSLSLGLLAGRLDSRLIGLPNILVATMYLNVILLPLSSALSCLDNLTAGKMAIPTSTSAAMASTLHDGVRITLASVGLARLPLELLLFVSVLWCVRGRALERYLTYIEQVATSAPRSNNREHRRDSYPTSNSSPVAAHASTEVAPLAQGASSRPPDKTSRGTILFVHGLGGHPQATWGRFHELIAADPQLKEYDTASFGFPTSLFRLPFSNKYPKIQTLADALHTQIEARHADSESIILVCHSLGGLIARRYIVDQVKRRSKLRVHGLILFAVPNGGAALAEVAKYVSWKHNQLHQLCRDSDLVRDLDRDWTVLNVGEQIPVRCIVGGIDRVVAESSARSSWGNLDVEVIADRGHIDLVKAQSESDLSYVLLRKFVLSLPATHPKEVAASSLADPNRRGAVKRYATPLAAIHTASSYPRGSYRVIAFDVDGTLVRGIDFSWTVVWKYLGFPESLYRGAMRDYRKGKITYAQWCDMACTNFRAKGLKREDFAEIVAPLSLTKNFADTIRVLRGSGFVVALISGGMDVFLYEMIPNATELFDYICTNRIHFDPKTGVISNIEPTPFDFEGKAIALEGICERHGCTVKEAVFVGEGFNDEQVVNKAGLSIAYPPGEMTIEAAAISIEDDDLSRILEHVL
jgi:phosphoserine phosphatase